MDVVGFARFHASVKPLPSGTFATAPGGLREFVHKNVREKVFLLSIYVFEDRWATRVLPFFTSEGISELRMCMRVVVDLVVSSRLSWSRLRNVS